MGLHRTACVQLAGWGGVGLCSLLYRLFLAAVGGVHLTNMVRLGIYVRLTRGCFGKEDVGEEGLGKDACSLSNVLRTVLVTLLLMRPSAENEMKTLCVGLIYLQTMVAVVFLKLQALWGVQVCMRSCQHGLDAAWSAALLQLVFSGVWLPYVRTR